MCITDTEIEKITKGFPNTQNGNENLWPGWGDFGERRYDLATDETLV